MSQPFGMTAGAEMQVAGGKGGATLMMRAEVGCFSPQLCRMCGTAIFHRTSGPAEHSLGQGEINGMNPEQIVEFLKKKKTLHQHVNWQNQR